MRFRILVVSVFNFAIFPEGMPVWTRKAIEIIWQHRLEDVEAINAYTKSILSKSTDFLRHVVSEKGGRGAMTFTYACEHCDLFLVEDFLRWVGTMEKRKTEKQHEWEVWNMRNAI